MVKNKNKINVLSHLLSRTKTSGQLRSWRKLDEWRSQIYVHMPVSLTLAPHCYIRRIGVIMAEALNILLSEKVANCARRESWDISRNLRALASLYNQDLKSGPCLSHSQISTRWLTELEPSLKYLEVEESPGEYETSWRGAGEPLHSRPPPPPPLPFPI